MRAGDIIFISGTSLLSRIVRFFDGKGKFSHVTIALSNNSILEAQYYKKSSIVPFSYEHYEIIDLGLSESQRRKVQELGLDLVGRNYDFIQIVSYFIKDVFNKRFRIINNPNDYICSEIVEVILQEIGVMPNDDSLKDMTPNVLFEYLTSLKHKEVIK
jgi:cell wall-associated NlpC family hydrolase